MLFKKSPEKFRDLVSTRYAASPIADRAAYETKIEKIRSCLSPEDVVLDIGCGTGTQCGNLAGHVKQKSNMAGRLVRSAGQLGFSPKVNLLTTRQL